jgi:rhodanese-related sulfurtransferase
MPSPDTITVSQLLRLVGTPEAPVIIDVRTADDFEADPRLIPGAVRRDWQTVRNWPA